MTPSSPHPAQQWVETGTSHEADQNFHAHFSGADGIAPIASNKAAKQRQDPGIHGSRTEPQVKPTLPLRKLHTKKLVSEGSITKQLSIEHEPDLSLPPRPKVPSQARHSRRARNFSTQMAHISGTGPGAPLPRFKSCSRMSTTNVSEEVCQDSGQGAQKHKIEVAKNETKPSVECAAYKLSPHAAEFHLPRPSSGRFNPVPVQNTLSQAPVHPDRRTSPTNTKEHVQPQPSSAFGPKNKNRRKWNRDGRPYKFSKNGGVQHARPISFTGQPPMHAPLPPHNGFQGGPATSHNLLQGSLSQEHFNSLPNINQFQLPPPNQIQSQYPTHGSPRAFPYLGLPQAQFNSPPPPPNFYITPLPGPQIASPNPNFYSFPPPSHNFIASDYQLPNYIRVNYPLNQGFHRSQIHPKDLNLPAPVQGYYELTKSGPLLKLGSSDDSNLHSHDISNVASTTGDKEESVQLLAHVMKGLSLNNEAGQGGEQSEKAEKKETTPIKRKTIYF
jgi:hypothetical protein